MQVINDKKNKKVTVRYSCGFEVNYSIFPFSLNETCSFANRVHKIECCECFGNKTNVKFVNIDSLEAVKKYSYR